MKISIHGIAKNMYIKRWWIYGICVWSKTIHLGLPDFKYTPPPPPQKPKK